MCRFWIVQLFIVCLAIIQRSASETHRTLDEARAVRQNLVQKYLKKSKQRDGDIKLVGGRAANEGNVEVFHKGRWGAVCDDEWDKREGEVVCRQLGYSNVQKTTHSSMFGSAKRRFWMDNIFCVGTEATLAACKFDGWGHSDCEASEAAGVICDGKISWHVDDMLSTLSEQPEPGQASVKMVTALPKRHRKKHRLKVTADLMDVRLAGGRIPEEGRVEVRFGTGPWGTVCGDGWSLLEANVVCRHLGLGYANDAYQTDYFGGSNETRLLVSGTECVGNETNLAECVHNEFGKRINCPGPINHVATVSCIKQMADLMFDHYELESSAHLEDRMLYLLTCAMEENCLASHAYTIQQQNPSWHLETRRLLKFTARVLNVGNADFRPHIPKHLWEWHMCHMHYHSMEVFATFDVIDSVGNRVAEGHKASFCLEDNQCLSGVEPKYACANYGDQGISVNCSDIYRYTVDCQWVDISEIDFGTYTLKVSINPEFKVPEMSFDNNAASCTLLYTESYARVINCALHRP